MTDESLDTDKATAVGLKPGAEKGPSRNQKIDLSPQANAEEEEFVISKSQIKRELQALRDLAKSLVALSPAQLAKLPLSDDLRENLLKAKEFKNKALKRQLQHLGVLLRNEAHEDIKLALDRLGKPLKKEVKKLHKLEQLRDQLIAGDQATLDQLFEQYEISDRQYLLQMIRNAKRERDQNKSPKSSRALFTYLKELSQQEASEKLSNEDDLGQ